MPKIAENQPNVYSIPDNFFGESRLLSGRIRVRYLIDSIILSLLLFVCVTLPILLFGMRGMPLNVKAPVLVVTIGPGFLAGMLGYNGDPISVFLKNVITWRKSKSVRLYNESPRLLGTDPVKAVCDTERGKDKLVKFLLQREADRIAKKTAEQYVLGENFEFAYDPNIDGYTEDNGDFETDAGEAEAPPVDPTWYVDEGYSLGGLEGFYEDFYGNMGGDEPEEETPSEGATDVADEQTEPDGGCAPSQEKDGV